MTFFSKKTLRLLLLPALLLLTGLLSAALTGCGGGSTEQAAEDGQTADGGFPGEHETLRRGDHFSAV